MRTLVSPTQFVSDSRLAVSENGDATVAWLQGRPPEICAEACPPPAHPWLGAQVMVAQGTVPGGFDKPLRLSSQGAGQLYLAQLSSGVAYVAWTKFPQSLWRIQAISRGRISQPTLLPADAQLQGLFAGRSRQVAAVWVTPGNPRWEIHYAFLEPGGRLGHQGNIAAVTREFSYPHVALNDRGDIAALWLQGGQTMTPKLGLCDSRRLCSPARSVAVPSAQDENTALTLADDGTATALIGGHTRYQALGLWAVVAHVDRRQERVAKLAPAADFPVAVAAGRGGAVGVFKPTGDTLAWTFLDPASEQFTRPTPLPDRRTDSPPEIAANLSGQSIAAWFHFTRFQNPTYELRASLGTGSRLSRPAVIAQPSTNPAEGSVSTGIDEQGNALVTWGQFSSHGDKGLFAAIHGHR